MYTHIYVCICIYIYIYIYVYVYTYEPPRARSRGELNMFSFWFLVLVIFLTNITRLLYFLGSENYPRDPDPEIIKQDAARDNVFKINVFFML